MNRCSWRHCAKGERSATSTTRSGEWTSSIRIRHLIANGSGRWRIRIVTMAPETTGNVPSTREIRVPSGDMSGALRVSRWNAKTSSTGAAISTERSRIEGRDMHRS